MIPMVIAILILSVILAGVQVMILARFGRGWWVLGDRALTGGPFLEKRAHGVVVDLSFDAALAAQRQRLYQLPQLRLEEQALDAEREMLRTYYGQQKARK